MMMDGITIPSISEEAGMPPGRTREREWEEERQRERGRERERERGGESSVEVRPSPTPPYAIYSSSAPNMPRCTCIMTRPPGRWLVLSSSSPIANTRTLLPFPP
ncbi:uncharacterized protein K489DRAFT_4226 [Dissoconium aciculare CBS 342.82]|uniref:Uncharacterized protein n=1 Tax=Dissoconium aciculare CBS 342.82 TaxID=1314786 RepID=A0A6J3MGD3_9PEZI|nr:uncharacterized protein K489DRAFT_4226 [Dissoconium aciculare CBS 342.82]KAF1827015.1 hypothetical protein K489DRAFT_4226 [Dissoconium aciculare CBS 342.82]